MEVQISLARTPYSLVKKTGIFGSILLKIQPTFSSQYSGPILTLRNHTHCVIDVLHAAAGSLLAFLDLYFCDFFFLPTCCRSTFYVDFLFIHTQEILSVKSKYLKMRFAFSGYITDRELSVILSKKMSCNDSIHEREISWWNFSNTCCVFTVFQNGCQALFSLFYLSHTFSVSRSKSWNIWACLELGYDYFLPRNL